MESRKIVCKILCIMAMLLGASLMVSANPLLKSGSKVNATTTVIGDDLIDDTNTTSNGTHKDL